MWLDYWKLTTFLIAAFAAYVAYRQHRLGKEKFKLDLFEKRYRVFAATRLLLTHVLQNGNVTLPELFEYRAGIGEASFLFSSDLVEYLEEIYRHALKLHTDHESVAPLPRGDERSRLAEEICTGTGWLTDQLPELKKRFAPYMAFNKWH